jgi:hypothetical protein
MANRDDSDEDILDDIEPDSIDLNDDDVSPEPIQEFTFNHISDVRDLSKSRISKNTGRNENAAIGKLRRFQLGYARAHRQPEPPHFSTHEALRSFFDSDDQEPTRSVGTSTLTRRSVFADCTNINVGTININVTTMK